MKLHDILSLESYQAYPSITIQLPMHTTMPERQEDPVRVKQAVNEVATLLSKEPRDQVELLLKKIDELVRGIDYTVSQQGIVLLVSNAHAEVVMLPFRVHERVSVGDHFELRDVIRGMQRMIRYWVLELSQKPSRLFLGTGDRLEEIIEPAKDSLGIERDGFPFEYLGPQETRYDAIETGDKDARYHDDHLKNFFRKVDHLLHKFIEKEPLPLVLVGDREDIVYFEEVTKHKQSLIAHIHGSYPKAPAYELIKVVWPHILNYEAQQRADVKQQFIEALGRAQHAFGLEWVWRVASEGRVHVLLVEDTYSVPGFVDAQYPHELVIGGATRPGNEREDLVARVIDTVLEKGGKVVYLTPGELKDYQHIAAILRY